MVLTKLGWKLGFTEKRVTELSDILYETATVIAKNYQEEEDNLVLGIAMGNPALGIAMSDDEEFNIHFRGETVSFNLDDRGLFNYFKVGDTVELGYRKIYTIIYDYVPPNFDHKQVIDKFVSDCSFVSAKKVRFES